MYFKIRQEPNTSYFSKWNLSGGRQWPKVQVVALPTDPWRVSELGRLQRPLKHCLVSTLDMDNADTSETSGNILFKLTVI